MDKIYIVYLNNILYTAERTSAWKRPIIAFKTKEEAIKYCKDNSDEDDDGCFYNITKQKNIIDSEGNEIVVRPYYQIMEYWLDFNSVGIATINMEDNK